MSAYELSKKVAVESFETHDGSYLQWTEQRSITTMVLKRDGKPIYTLRLDNGSPHTFYQVRDIEQLVVALNRP
ncbi:hypothetical protein [Deinococcus humi]|uniref:Uncharacterized protein n=1 Tax=Deinococcus humi TaxID=662880 RepID=A0A7W8JSR6_9DEIO|nr:hypothetical protein [Deinococcus humi]MBB5361323.1 hypothetical protein [Deinococcus humi]GGO19478.1 hypothetical protein GCM10008949_03880 [Deinococcus humi]